ncbi:MAG: 2-dehydropantoate 2-reductase [Gammaproteobacteria bacterium]|nr:2-dehydropantoate 2-reductase [Gammaproteobacteria bacterium]
MPAITVIGPGAIGGMVAARLCQNPHNDVTVVARTPFARLSLTTPDGGLRADPRIVTSSGDPAPADWVLVATKAYDSASAAACFDAALTDETCVAVLQNGVNHVERFSEFLPRERILPVIVDCPTERVAPGEIRQRGPAVLTVPAGDLGTRFEALFADTGVDCRQTEDFTSVAWWKLCVNAAGVVNALVLQPARIAHDQAAAQVMRRIIDEAAAVGRAEGAHLSPDIAEEVIDMYRNQPPDSVNSLHADRAAGRPMEIDLRNGIVAELGRKHGIATPCNAMAVSLLKIN